MIDNDGHGLPVAANDSEDDRWFVCDDKQLEDLLNLACDIAVDGGNQDSATLLSHYLGRVEGRLAANPVREPKPVYQTEFGPRGNCMSAALATVLGLELSQVPSFFDGDDATWWDRVRDWLSAFGLGLISVNIDARTLDTLPGWLLVGMKTFDGGAHATVWKDGRLWHDPFPGGLFTVGVCSVDLLYPLNPSNYRGTNDV